LKEKLPKEDFFLSRMSLLYFIFLSTLFYVSNGHSVRYYDMINDLNNGIDYYEVLQISPSASISEIKKAFRTLSRQYHPDKNKTEGSEAFFIQLSTAYEVLSDEDMKIEYDDLKDHGIPWQEQYYGRYAHSYGVPQHDIRHVMVGIVLLVTVAKYLYQWYRYEVIKNLAKRTPRYKQKKNEIKRSKESKNRQKDDNVPDSDEPQILLHGLDMPTWKNLFVVQLILFPIQVVTWLFQMIAGKKLSDEERIQLYCDKMGITREEYDKKSTTNFRKARKN